MTSPPLRDEEHASSTGSEQSPLLAPTSPDPARGVHVVPSYVSRRLYVSHSLSTWNSRVFEFGAVLYLAGVFPGTLVPMSLYALLRGLSAIVFAASIGSYIDSGDRLQVVRVSIIFQRLAVAASCAIFYTFFLETEHGSSSKKGMLALVTLLACVEKLCSILNTVSVEKDWVVVIAERDPEALRHINSQMRRIDLLCKLLGPLFIALVDGYSTRVALVVNFSMNAASIVVEYFAIARVYHTVPALQATKMSQQPGAVEEPPQRPRTSIWNTWNSLIAFGKQSAQDFSFYFHHQAFLPSFAGAILYLTVLAFSGQMVTYLLAAGFGSVHVAVARTFGVGLEVLATWVAPWLMASIGPVRAGLWMSTWQVSTLAAGVVVFLAYERHPLVSAGGLVFGAILSRLGLRGFDLCVQIIVQEDVESVNCGVFSSVEAAWQNVFEILSYISTIVFFRPSQFKWPSLMSLLAVISANVTYASFVKLRRGHILHLEKLAYFTPRRREGLSGFQPDG